MEKVVHPLVDRADWVVHSHLKKINSKECQASLFQLLAITVNSTLMFTDLMKGLAGIDGVPVPGFRDQSRQQ